MKKLFQIILAVAIVGLVYVIYVQISTPIRFDKETKAKKAQVIDRIKDIRTAQRAFKSKYQHFTASFDSLSAFVLTDTLELERKIVDEDDSVGMAMLKKSGKKNIEKFKIAVIDTIFAPKKVTRQAIENLRYIPGTEAKESYLAMAEKQLRTLASKEYLAEPGTNECFILKHSVGALPDKSEVDVPLTYADYYFLEALLRYKNLQK